MTAMPGCGMYAVRFRPVQTQLGRVTTLRLRNLVPCARQVMNELPYLVEWITYYHIQGTHLALRIAHRVVSGIQAARLLCCNH